MLPNRRRRRCATIEALEDRSMLSLDEVLSTSDIRIAHVAATPLSLDNAFPTVVTSPEDSLPESQGTFRLDLDPSAYLPMPIPDPLTSGFSEDPGQLVSYHVATREVRWHDPVGIDPQQMFGQTDAMPPARGAFPAEPMGGSPENFTNLSLIASPWEFPWSVNVKGFSTFPNNMSYVWSGTLIDPLHVLTAGHCVVDAQDGGWAVSARVVPGFDNGNSPYGDANVVDVVSWTPWVNDRDFDHDIAIITLDRPIGALTGWHGYGYNDSPSFYTGTTFHNAGYPAASPYNGQSLYYHYGNFDSTDTFLGIWTGHEVSYAQESYGGQSGSSAYTFTGSPAQRVAYAVLSNGNSQVTNFPRITQGKFNDIGNWIGQHTPSSLDLVALDVELPVNQVSAGGTLNPWDYQVHNYSSASWSGTVGVSVYLSSDRIITPTDTLVQLHSFSWEFDPKSTVIVSPPVLNIPTGFAGGDYFLGVILNVSDFASGNNDSSGQDAEWITVVPDDHGSNPTLATPIRSDSVTGGNLELVTDTDWFVFHASTSTALTLTTTLGSLGDSTLTLYASDGVTQLAFDDDGGGGRASRIASTIGSRGLYFVKVASYNSSYSGSYSLSLTHVDDHGDLASIATSLSVPGTASGSVEVGGDTDWFSFYGTPGTEVTLETSLGTLSDSTLSLYFSDGTSLLAYDDDGGPGSASKLSHTISSFGYYYVKVAGYSPYNDSGTYGLTVAFDDHADTPGYATLIPAKSTTLGNLEDAADFDWLSFYAEAGTAVRIETRLYSLLDSTLALYASDGVTQLAFDDDGGGGRASLIQYTTTTAGQYYVRVASYNAASSGTYDVVFTHTDDHGDNASSGSVLTAANVAAGSLEVGGDQDWFRFFVAAGNRVTLETTLGTLPDSTLTLYDTTGLNPLAFDDDGGAGLASRIEYTFPVAGTYYASVTEYGQPNGPGTYHLSLSIANDRPGDFNRDGIYDILDLDALVAAIVGGAHPSLYDLTGDGEVNLLDRDAWLAEAGAANLPSGNPYLVGDADLSGAVDGSDFGLWNANKFTRAAGWSRGDFNADGWVDASDFGLWNANKFTSSDGTARRQTALPPIRPGAGEDRWVRFLDLTDSQELNRRSRRVDAFFAAIPSLQQDAFARPE